MVSTRASSTTGPSASPTPVEMIPCTQSTFSCCTSLPKRSIVSLGEDSSSMTSSILRPAMPAWALKRSTAHCVARMPFSPGAAAMPERGARRPMRTGLFCAIAGAKTSPATESAPAAAADFSSVRRETAIGCTPLEPWPRFRPDYSDWRRRYIRRMSATSACADPVPHSRVGTQKRVDLLPGERPIIIEIGDNFPHEWIREPDRPILVAEMVVEDGERELLRAISLVGPLEAKPGEPLDLVMLVQLFAVSRDEKAVDRTLSLIDRHDHNRHRCTREGLHVV